MQPTPYHAWDCRCGSRNAPEFATCHRCGLPAHTGRMVAWPDAPPPVPQPPRSPWGWSPRVRPMVWIAVLAFAAGGFPLLFGGAMGLFHWLALLIGVVLILAAHIIDAATR
jgi:hypothetical protein